MKKIKIFLNYFRLMFYLYVIFTVIEPYVEFIFSLLY